MSKGTKGIIRAASILVVLLIIFFGGKRIYYSNRAFFYRYSWFRPANTSAIRWNNFLRSKPDSLAIIFSGTSITAGFPLQQAFKNNYIINLGFGYNQSFYILQQVTQYISRQPKKIFLEAGINDFRHRVSTDSVYKNFIKIYQVIKTCSPQTQLYVQSVLPTNVDYLNDSIIVYNKEISAFCKQNGVSYIDLYPLFSNGGRINQKLTTDGIHLNIDGYLLWKKILEPYLMQINPAVN